MITLYTENGYMLQLDKSDLVVTDEGYGTVERFPYCYDLYQDLVLEHKKILRESGE